MSEEQFRSARYNLVIVAGVILMVASALLGTLFADYGIVFVFTLLASIAVAVFGALKRFGKGTVSKWNNRFWKYYGMTAFWCTFLLVTGDPTLQLGVGYLLGVMLWVGMCLYMASASLFFGTLHLRRREGNRRSTC